MIRGGFPADYNARFAKPPPRRHAGTTPATILLDNPLLNGIGNLGRIFSPTN